MQAELPASLPKDSHWVINFLYLQRVRNNTMNDLREDEDKDRGLKMKARRTMGVKLPHNTSSSSYMGRSCFPGCLIQSSVSPLIQMQRTENEKSPSG